MLRIKYKQKNRDEPYREEIVSDEHYLKMYNETEIDPELGVAIPKWDIDIIEKLPDPEPEPEPEDLVLEIIQKHLELHEACEHHGTIYEQVVQELRDKELLDAFKPSREPNSKD